MRITQISPLALSVLLFAAGCGDKDTEISDSLPTATDDTSAPLPTDNDGDGVTAADGDCDDEDGSRYPGRAEDCNGVDDNCNDIVDEGFSNVDGDDLADCVDEEDCDGVDNDGDEAVDEGFEDVDANGVADCVDTEQCDGIDNDADGLIDEGFDVDQDSYTSCNGDCDDDDPDVFPSNTEVADDGKDNDCDGLVDETGFSEGALAIVEVLNNPLEVLDPMGEWFEVYNTSDAAIILNGIVISSSGDGNYHQIASEEVLSVEPGEVFVLGANGDRATNGGVDVDYVYSDITLFNEADELSLSADGVVLDSVSWDDGGDMPDPNGASLTLDPWYYSATDNDNAEYWCIATEAWGTRTDLGSPGASNELCSTFDHDGDGFSGDEGDCDDADPSVYPDAPELDAGVDNDCDGEAEAMPTAVADYDASSTLLHCDVLYLDGSASFDPDGSSLTYSWELTSAPASSALTSSDIDTSSSSEKPEFTPDVEGTYVFSLTVNDGGTDSFPVTLSIDISTQTSNTDPVADAGSDSSYSESVTCSAYSYGAYYTCDDCNDKEYELNGSNSSDVNSDDHMVYAWSVSSTTSSSTTTSFDDSTSSAPTLTVGGVAATYGSTTTEEITVGMTVTDCYGASASDTVVLTFECTGI